MKYLLVLCLILFSGFEASDYKPIIYIVGDSTVKNGSGKGEGGLWGWGDLLSPHFDSTKIHIQNYARGGRSSRTYQTEGLWQQVASSIHERDFVIIQFGHNDGGPVNDTLRARGTLRGIGSETEEIDNLITKKHEVVHTYGWYMRKYIRDIRARGGIPVVCSPVARNIWKDGKVERSTDSYALWAHKVAKAEGALYIDLNDAVATRYEQLGPDYVTSNLFLKDHTHTNLEGAKINAELFAGEIRKKKGIPLKKYLREK